jgi:hypothetical protein
MDAHVTPCAAAILLAVSLVAACQPNPSPSPKPTPAPIPAPNPRPEPSDPSPSDPTAPQIPTPSPNGQPGRGISPQAQIVTQRDTPARSNTECLVR